MCAEFSSFALISRLRHYERCVGLQAKKTFFSSFAMKFKIVHAETLAARKFGIKWLTERADGDESLREEFKQRVEWGLRLLLSDEGSGGVSRNQLWLITSIHALTGINALAFSWTIQTLMVSASISMRFALDHLRFHQFRLHNRT